MESSPAAPFKVPQSEFLLQFLIIAFDNPAVFGGEDQPGKLRISRERGEPVLCRLLLSGWPFDEEPFFRMRFSALVIAVSGPDTNSGKP